MYYMSYQNFNNTYFLLQTIGYVLNTWIWITQDVVERLFLADGTSYICIITKLLKKFGFITIKKALLRSNQCCRTTQIDSCWI